MVSRSCYKIIPSYAPHADACKHSHSGNTMATGLSEPPPDQQKPEQDTSNSTIHVRQCILEKLKNDLEDKLQEGKDGGLAIVVGNSEGNHVLGVDKDVQAMCEAFSEQGLTVWDMMDVSSQHIVGALLTVAEHKFAPSYDRFVFYYCGRGGSKNNCPYIRTTSFDGKDDGTLSIEEGILSPLRSLKGLESRFLFDCCLHTNVLRCQEGEQRDTWETCDSLTDSMANCLSGLSCPVVISVSNSSCDRVDGNKGGASTPFLLKCAKYLGENFKDLRHRLAEFFHRDDKKESVDEKDSVDSPSTRPKRKLSLIHKDGGSLSVCCH